MYVEHKEQELGQEMAKRSNFENLVQSSREELQVQKTKTKEAHVSWNFNIYRIDRRQTNIKREHVVERTLFTFTD